jgi:propanol-preferring alcohol dehydrogenase
MKAMILKATTRLESDRRPLVLEEVARPDPREGEVLVKVSACGVCHTEIDEIEGRTPPPLFPVIPGHQVVGTVVETGSGVSRLRKGDRVGVAWIFSSCGRCRFCLEGSENLCPGFKATGRDAHGGYAEFMTVPEASAFVIPPAFSDAEAAPLLCAGAIGYRSLRLTGLGDGLTLGLIGFGASAHLVLKMVRHRFPASRVFVFARSEKERSFAMELGAAWAGDTAESPPDKIHCAIDTTPAWEPIVHGLGNLEAGGRLVINAIRKEETDKGALLKIDYAAHLWLEKEIKSVANVARADVRGMLDLAAAIPLRPEIQTFPLDEANRALVELKERKIRGAKVLVI